LIAALALSGQSRAAQPRKDGSVEVGGTVSSFLGLVVTQPNGLGSFPGTHAAGSYTSSFKAAVTSTDVVAQLSVTDEGQYGHLTSGAAVLALPLQVAADGGHFASLGAPGGVVLERWPGPIAAKATVIHPLQRIAAPPTVTGPYHTTLLVTVASGTP
jgi:hypothetical protein